MAEFIPLLTDVPGVGRLGDLVIFNPESPDPLLRICVCSPLRGTTTEEVRAAIERAQGAGPKGPRPRIPHLTLVED